MKQFKLVLVVFLLLSAGFMFAQNVAVAFKDATATTKTVINQEFGTPAAYPNGYPFPTPSTGFDKWLIQFYRTTDDVINPVTAAGAPTGDDIEVVSIPPNYTQYLSFGPVTGGLVMSACTITPVGSTGNTHVGDKIYLRIFNANTKALATKSVAFTAPYIVLSATTQNVNIIPTYGWGTWTLMGVTAVPNPAVLVLPADAAGGLGYASQTLTWTAGTGEPPTGYKLYFGTDTAATSIINGTTQTNTTYITGSLLQNQTYYWKVVPYNASGDAVNCPIWSFTTRGEINPEAATNPIPAHGTTVQVATFPAEQVISWSPPSTGQTPTGYKLFWDHATTPEDLGNVLSTTKTLATPRNYTWQIVPYYTDPGTRRVSLGAPVSTRVSSINRSNNSRGDAVDCPTWGFTAVLAVTYNVNVTSTPGDADIFVDGNDSGYNTPHIFAMIEGASATYTVQKTGYTYAPVSYVVTNIHADMSQNFTGTILTYTVNLTSNPTDADIYIDGVDSGYNTTHEFVMNYGTSATYTLQKAGYSFTPASLVVTNIQANTTQDFSGSVLTYAVDINSTPVDADIFIGGVDSGFNTPHQFMMNYGTSATYTVQKAGYDFGTAEFAVTNIQAATNHTFTGTILTYTVDISSTPVDADIFVGGIDSGFNTPHQFVMNYGTSAIYTVQKTGYSFLPVNLVVNNIQANVIQEFIGSILTYTVDINSTPFDADIYVGGIDSGFNTPHQFVMDYGTSATYTVQKAGYTWSPSSFVVTNIQAITSQNFTGTVITYNVDITSTPPDADIFVDGVDSGFNTPHQFILNYGSNATYTVQKPGYAWVPANFVVTNIQANTSQNFAGTQNLFFVDINSTPADADIYVGGVDTGFNTPHQFAMAMGTNATYTVHKAGYNFGTAEFVVTNIQASTSHNFTGTILTYTVEITSTPAGAAIYVNGIHSDSFTPHTFTMDYGTGATYTVQKAGYSFAPTSYVVTNIQANTTQSFTGTLLTYTVDITSTPLDADIFVNGVDSGFNAPHQFVLNYGTSATYTVQKDGYTWAPASFVVTNIAANTSQNFVGTIITYNVDITSIPTDADIYVGGLDSGFNTPHTFVMNYGTSAIYTVQKPGYTWAPLNLNVTNIMANTAQAFTGTIITYTVDINSNPSNADIFVNGVDSGFNTPHRFVMNYGTSALYRVQKAGYSWMPESYNVTNIQANAVQEFAGALLTYTVDITSAPDDADIYIGGIDTGFNTPHQFVQTYGTNAVYSVQKAGYAWNPLNYNVANIQANASYNFTGTLLTFTVNITSVPTGADIYVDGVDSGFNTPHQFVKNYGTSATYTLQKIGYIFAPASFEITNIQANTNQNFVGTFVTYTVDITSTPPDADIYLGNADTGFNTPHQFVLTYGSSAVYSVKKAGYNWNLVNFEINNITANASQEFTGTIITYTVDIASVPTEANIYVGGVNTGFTTPHQFVMDYGTSATYTVQKPGYTMTPVNYVVNNIHANASQMFTGSINSYNVVITSTPGNADIFVDGTDSGFNTPHQFTMIYNSSATYTVQRAGYSYSPESLIVSNIQANVTQNFVGVPLTYTVDITSSPTGADIFIGGRSSGEVTPHQFVLNYGETVSYKVRKTGYNWSPDSYLVSNIQANVNQNFVGTLKTFTINISSIPDDADIFIGGVDTGFNSPHAFVMNYGTSATYTISKAGYVWTPSSYIVSNITADASQTFIGIPNILDVTPANQNVSSQMGETSFAVNSNISWAVSENVSWITAITHSTGSGNGSFSVSYEANTASASRVGQITLSGSGIFRIVTITQAGGVPSFSVAESNLAVPSLAGVTTFNVTSNTQWEVSENVSWLSISPDNGTNNGVVTVTYADNPSTTARVGRISVFVGRKNIYVTVTQAGSQVALTVTPSVQNVSSYYSNTSFSITSNVNWVVTEAVSWISVAPQSGSNNGNITVTCTANTTAMARSGQISVTGGGITQIITVNQAGAPTSLSVTPGTQYVSSMAGFASFSVTSNTDWTISGVTPWITNVSIIGERFTAYFGANPTSSVRRGFITVSSGERDSIVVVSQAAGISASGDAVRTFGVYPNPFAVSTKIEMDIAKGDAEIAVYSIKGQLIKSFGLYGKGSHTLEWNGKDAADKQCSNGYYLIRYKSAVLTKTVKVLLLKN